MDLQLCIQKGESLKFDSLTEGNQNVWLREIFLFQNLTMAARQDPILPET